MTDAESSPRTDRLPIETRVKLYRECKQRRLARERTRQFMISTKNNYPGNGKVKRAMELMEGSDV